MPKSTALLGLRKNWLPALKGLKKALPRRCCWTGNNLCKGVASGANKQQCVFEKTNSIDTHKIYCRYILLYTTTKQYKSKLYRKKKQKKKKIQQLCFCATRHTIYVLRFVKLHETRALSILVLAVECLNLLAWRCQHIQQCLSGIQLEP